MNNLFFPRIFHRIWLGKKSMPGEFVEYGNTWLKHHPNWQMWLWNDHNIIPLQNQQVYGTASSVVQKVDIARYEILYNFGGIYIDCDFECLRNIEDLLVGVEAFAASESKGIISNGIMGCKPGHQIFKLLIDNLPCSINDHRHEHITEQVGPGYVTRLIGNRKDLMVFGPELFYPYLWTEKHRKGEFFPNAYAVHHWAGSWLQPTALPPKKVKFRGRTRIRP
ncbi:MAG: glycosyltransferase [Syntrophomonas sp.]